MVEPAFFLGLRASGEQREQLNMPATLTHESHVEDGDEVESLEEESSGKKRRQSVVRAPTAKRHRGDSQRNAELYSHFRKIDERAVSKFGLTSNHFLCVCNYCEAVYNKKLEQARKKKVFSSITPPKKIRRSRRDCHNHLKNCQNYRGKTRNNKQWRQTVQSSGDSAFTLGPNEMPVPAAAIYHGDLTMMNANFKTPQPETSDNILGAVTKLRTFTLYRKELNDQGNEAILSIDVPATPGQTMKVNLRKAWELDHSGVLSGLDWGRIKNESDVLLFKIFENDSTSTQLSMEAIEGLQVEAVLAMTDTNPIRIEVTVEPNRKVAASTACPF